MNNSGPPTTVVVGKVQWTFLQPCGVQLWILIPALAAHMFPCTCTAMSGVDNEQLTLAVLALNPPPAAGSSFEIGISTPKGIQQVARGITT